MKYLRVCSQLLPLVFVAVLVALINPVVNAEPVSEESSERSTKWYRHVFRVEQASGVDALVAVSAPSTCRVWLNGQRLRYRGKADQVSAFETTRLLRNGANCLAIEAWSAADVLPVSLRIGGQPTTGIRCQMKASQPPVGWQKTDFNDRDWQSVQLQLTKVDWESLQVQSLVAPTTQSRYQENRFRFRDNDHVVLLGGTFVERAQQFGHLEAALMTSDAKHLTFRNLGWSADTVFAESRGIFDTPEKGYARLIEHLRAEEPDVVLIQYGQNEALQEQSATDADKFREQYQQLIADVRTTGAEVVLLTPHPFLQAAPPLPDPRMWNPVLARYARIVGEVAEQTGCHTVNLYDDFERRLLEAAQAVGFWRPGLLAEDHPDLLDSLFQSLSDNGMHWNERGYRCVSMLVANSLFGDSSLTLNVQIQSQEGGLQVAVSEAAEISVSSGLIGLKLQSPWLKPGALIVDDLRTTVSVENCSFDSGTGTVALTRLPSGEEQAAPRFDCSQDYQQLLELLVRKNELYFHRWRPQNITYLFGFRKHEQGNNASEIAEFDPLIVELEQRIQSLVSSDGPTIRLELK